MVKQELAACGRCRSRRAYRQQLCSASSGQTRSACRTDRRSASSARPSRAWHIAGAGPTATGGADPAIGAARVCRLPRVWISRANAAPPSAGTTRARGGRISGPVEFVAASPGDGPGLFGPPFGDGEGNRTRPPAGPDCAPTRANAARPPAAAGDKVAKTGSRAAVSIPKSAGPRRRCLICDNAVHQTVEFGWRKNRGASC